MTPSSGTTIQAGDGIATPSGHEPDARGHFGRYGGRFVPEALVAALDELAATYEKARHDDEFLGELNRLQRDYTGRPSPLTDATRLSEHAGGARILLKREDLNHTGSHKINNVLGQALLTKLMGKTPGDRRDRGGPARRRDGHGLRAARARVRGLHGRGRHPPPGAQRRADAAARAPGSCR